MGILKVNKLQNINGEDVLDGTSGRLVLPPGTTTKPPLTFTASTSVTTPVAGSIEYNGRSFYTTPDAISGKAFNDEGHFYALDADRTIIATVVAGTDYSIFGVGIPVAPDSAYLVDIVCGLRTGATSHNIAFRFGGNATYTDCQFRTEFTNLALSTGSAAAGTPTAAVTLMFTANPALRANAIISPASTLVSKFFRVHGVITTSSGGTIDPQISFSANPTGTNAVTRLSYIKLNPIGTSTGTLVAGNWS
jgi:hypothetical protein